MKILKSILIKEVIYPILIILFSILIYLLLKNFTKKIFGVKVKKVDIKRKNTAYSIIINLEKYFIIVVAFLMILNVFGVDTMTLVTSLGIVGLAAGLAVQDTLKDFISGVSIVFENKYSVGDNVTIGDFRGDVIELGMKTTKIRAYTGEVLIIPNHLVEKVINHSMSKSVAIVDIDVSYDSNLEKVEKVLEELCKNLTKELNGLKGEVQLLGINELASSSIKYRIIADTVPLKNYEIERKIKKELKIILDQNKIEIPYNQVVIHSAK